MAAGTGAGLGILGGITGGIGDIMASSKYERPKLPPAKQTESHYRRNVKQLLDQARQQYEGATGIYNQMAPFLLGDLAGLGVEYTPDAGAQASLDQAYGAYQDRLDAENQLNQLQANKRGAKKGADRKAAKKELKQFKKGLKGTASLDELRLALGQARTDPGLYKLTKKGPTLEDTLQQQYQDTVAQRALDAAQGKADFDPYLVRLLDADQAQLEEKMRRQMGTDWESSTPGIGALNDFYQRKQETLRNSAFDEMQRLRQLGLGGAEAIQGLQGGKQQLYANVPQTMAGFAEGMAGMTQPFLAGQEPYQKDRFGQFEASTFPSRGEKRGQYMAQSGDRWASIGGNIGSTSFKK